MVLKGSHTLLTLAITILLARVIGAEQYGVYAFVYALVNLLGIPAQLGVPTLVVREIAAYQIRGEWGLMRGLLTRGFQAVLVTAASVALAGLLGALLFSGRLSEVTLQTSAWGLLLLPLLALSNLRGSALRGLGKVVQGLLPEQLLLPGAFLLLLASTLLNPTTALGASHVMALHVLAAAFAFVVGALLLVRTIPVQVRDVVRQYDTRRWVASVVPLALIAGMQVINRRTDIVMLGFFATAEDVGVYRVVSLGASQVCFTLSAVNAVIAPQISQLYASGDHERLQRMVTISARVILLTALPVAGTLIAFGSPLLSMVFGAEYAVGGRTLAILSLGQLFNAGMGSVGLLLNMTGHERDTARGLAVAAAGNVLLNLLLVPPFGIEGAAAATVVTYGIWNVVLARQVYRRLGVVSLGITPPRRGSKSKCSPS
jgi:O-antigen/teichoic acid export membrane protein